MSDKGIIFSAAMVRALLAGTKTQTRRLLADGPKEGAWHCDADPNAPSGRRFVADGGGLSLPCLVPYAAGDRLYVREAWSVRGQYTDVVEVGYRASERSSHTEFVEQIPVAHAVPGKGKWPAWPKYGPSIHMPRWASRILLTVTDVRVQRLQDISEADGIAEGCPGRLGPNPEFPDEWDPSPVEAYQALWNSLHAGPGTTWSDNPWIVAVSFDVARHNIDRAPR